MVRATRLTPEYIVKAIKAGNCYASSGVTLRDVRYDPNSRTLGLEIEPDGDATYMTQFIGTLRGADVAGQPITTAGGEAPRDKSGNPLRASRRYSDQVGQVLKTVEGLKASYQLTGSELYVRAAVTSSKPPHDPSFAGQRQQAWTQPIGWEWLNEPAEDAKK